VSRSHNHLEAKEGFGRDTACEGHWGGYVNMSLYREVDFGKDSTEGQLHNPIT